MGNLPVNPLEEVFPRVVASIDAWISANNAEVIRADISRRLNTAQEEIVRKLLGFNKDYRGWELDHCNGRAGESAAGKYLYEQNKIAVDAWLSQVQLPIMSDTFRQKVEKQMQFQFESAVLRRAGEVAQKAAEDVLTQLKGELLKTDVVDKFFKTQKLISGEQE